MNREVKRNLKKLDEALKHADTLLQILDNTNKMLDNLNSYASIFSACTSSLSKTKIDLPPSPPLTTPPITAPEDLKKYQELIEKAIKALDEQPITVDDLPWRNKGNQK